MCSLTSFLRALTATLPPKRLLSPALLFLTVLLATPARSETTETSPDSSARDHDTAQGVLVRQKREMDHDAIEARRRHQERLQKHLAHHSDDHAARFEMAEVMADRGFFNDAIHELDKVLRADSTRVDVWRSRAGWYRELGLVRGEWHIIDNALDSYRAMFRLGRRRAAGTGDEDRAGDDSRVFYDEIDLIAAAGVALACRDAATAEQAAAAIDRDGPRGAVADLLLGAAHYQNDRLEEAAFMIDQVRAMASGPLLDAIDGRALAGVDARSRRIREARLAMRGTGDLLAVASPEEAPIARAVSVAVPPPRRLGAVALACPGLGGPALAPDAVGVDAVRLAGFWKSQDPTPTTPVNERYLEHCYRVLVADALFSRSDVAGRDSDRGETFIRYGRPTQQIIDGATFVTRLVQRAGGYRDPVTQLQYPRVHWEYRVGDRFLRFMFEDLTMHGDFWYSDKSAYDAQALARTNPYIYKREVPAGVVRVADAQTRFRGRREDVIVALSAAVSAVRLSGDTSRDSWDDIEVRWVVFDRAYRTVASSAMRLDAAECVYQDSGGRRFLLGRADFDLPAGDYVMACEFRDHATGKEGIVKREMTVEPVDGLLSEIELCRDARQVQAGSAGAFVRYDAQVVPNPRNEVATGDPLRFYYEIYGLGRSADGHRRCRIQHRVRSLKQPKDVQPSFPLAYSIEIDEPVGKYDSYMPRVGQLDVSSLRVGRYELQVVVEDLVTGETATRTIGFLRRP